MSPLLEKGGISMDGLVLNSAGSGVSQLLTTTASGMTSEIMSALPIAGGLFATIAGIFIGLKIFKRVTGART